MQYGSRESVFFEGSQRQEAFLEQKNIGSKKHQNFLFFHKCEPVVFVQKWRFFNLEFLCKMDQEKVFCKGSKGKEAFLDHENIGSKNHQHLHFFKGVSPWFLSKNGDFLIFSFYTKWIKKECFLRFRKKRSLVRP